ncbi:MAG: PEP-CTERM sorting domain-containing protein [Pirellulales bacterium]
MRAFLACVFALFLRTASAAPILVPFTVDTSQSFVKLSTTADGIYKQPIGNGFPASLSGTLNATLNLSSIYPIGIEINPSDISSQSIALGGVQLFESPSDTKFSHLVAVTLGFVSTGYSLVPTNIYFGGVFDNSQMVLQDSKVWPEFTYIEDESVTQYPYSMFGGTPVDVPFKASITVEPFGPNNLYTITLPLHQQMGSDVSGRIAVTELTGQIVATAVLPVPPNYAGEPDTRPLVPEPSTMIPMAVAVAAVLIAGVRRKGRSKKQFRNCC